MRGRKRPGLAAKRDSANLDTSDRDPEAHVALLLARMAHDLRIVYEPLDLSTVESARHALEVLTGVRSTLDSHSRAVAALTSHLQQQKAGRKGRSG